jgi:hypothetical protein
MREQSDRERSMFETVFELGTSKLPGFSLKRAWRAS